MMVVGLDTYWKSNDEWWHLEEDRRMVVNDDAPQKAQESYKHYLEQVEYYGEYI